jgi:hypothetical protein
MAAYRTREGSGAHEPRIAARRSGVRGRRRKVGNPQRARVERSPWPARQASEGWSS